MRKKERNGSVNRRFQQWGFMGAVLLSVLCLAACKGQSGGQTAADRNAETWVEYSAPGMSAMPNASMVAETGAAPAQGTGMTEGEAVRAAAADSGNMGAGVSGETGTLSSQGAQERKLIRNVNLDMETREFDSLVSQIKEKTEEMGGYIESSNLSGSSLNQHGSSGQRHADFTLRIPAGQLDAFLDMAGSLGNVISRQEQVTDVTLQYSDVESHKKSLEIERERLWELLEKADSLEAVVALEARLSEIRYQLESYASQLKIYDSQVTYSTVNLFVTEVQVLTATSPDSVGERIQKGFAKTLHRMEEEAVNLVVWLVVNSPVILCLSIFILVLVLAVRALERHVPSGKKKGNGKNRKSGKEKASQPGDEAKGKEEDEH